MTISGERIAAALAYTTVALTQRVRPAAAEHLDPTADWPESWTWTPAPTWQENLATATRLLEAELDAPRVVRGPSYPSQHDVAQLLEGHSPEAHARDLSREVDALLDALQQRERANRSYDEWTVAIQEHLGICMFLLLGLADAAGVDLATAANRCWTGLRGHDKRATTTWSTE